MVIDEKIDGNFRFSKSAVRRVNSRVKKFVFILYNSFNFRSPKTSAARRVNSRLFSVHHHECRPMQRVGIFGADYFLCGEECGAFCHAGSEVFEKLYH